MLIEFYGEECPHCITMKPLIDRLEKEESVSFEKYETWHNDDNEKKRQEYDKGFCGGVPFFVNTDNDTHICGAVPYDMFRMWARGNHDSGKKTPG